MVSLWEKESFYAPQDIIVAGSGFAGLWSAYFLKKKHPKRKITVVDKGIIPTGASTRNAGFSCFGSLTELLYDEQTMGSDKMVRLVEMRYQGLKRIRKTFGSRVIDYSENGGFELFTENDEYLAEDLRVKTEHLNQLLKRVLKSKKTFRLADEKIAGFGFSGVSHIVQNKLEGQLHPGKLVRALLQLVQSLGVQVLFGIEVKGYEKINGSLHIHTNLPEPLEAGQLLICTNAFAQPLTPGIAVEPARGQVLVTSQIEDLPWKGTFHYDEGFYYFRNIGKRILLGGARNQAFEEERTDSFATTTLIQQELERFLREIVIPGKSFTIEDRWSGIMGMGADKLPDLKEMEPNVFCAINMGGMGVALAPVIGQQVTGMMD